MKKKKSLQSGSPPFSFFKAVPPVAENCSSSLNLHKATSMVITSINLSFSFYQSSILILNSSSLSLKQDQDHPTLTLTPTMVTQDQPAATLLKLSPQTLVNSATAANNDLELSIAPPQPHSSLPSLSPGTIRVI